jgi:GntR family transcriptional regulator
MSKDRKPIYRVIAATLVDGIASEEYPVGSYLPTEHELSRKHSVSRATVTLAFRELEALGLIYRRPRRGTQVTSRFPMRNQLEEGGVLHDWAHYGVKFVFEVLNKGRDTLPLVARENDSVDAENWLRLSGRRLRPRTNGATCTVDAFIHPDYADIEEDVAQKPPRVFSLIEARYGFLVTAVDQELRVVPMAKESADVLGAEPGSCSVQVLRWYRGPRNKLVEFTLDTHPAHLFRYRTRTRRTAE